MRKIIKRPILCCLALFAVFFTACAYDAPSLRVEKSLPPQKLARYNDRFDSLREDMWEQIGFIRYVSGKTNFKQADVSVKNGQLRVETKIGCFSSGGISSRFLFKGDFDVQVDCEVSFLKGISSMDQLIYFLAADITLEADDNNLENVFLQLSKGGINHTWITGASFNKGQWYQCDSKKIDDYFKGTFRIVRIGNQITILYTTKPEGEWQKACSFSRSSNDTLISLGVRNFLAKRTSIDAKLSLIVQFDNFRVNAAQEIIESDI